MYKYKRFYEIYNHQLLKTRALKRVKPKIVGSYLTQGHPKPRFWLELYLGLSRQKDRVLVGFKLLKSHLWYDHIYIEVKNNTVRPIKIWNRKTIFRQHYVYLSHCFSSILKINLLSEIGPCAVHICFVQVVFLFHSFMCHTKRVFDV